jgi:CubicO group peptidase (beta-lactamase class C family)
MSINQAANAAVQKAVDQTIADGKEIGVQVAAYLKGKLVIDVWGGVADKDTGKPVTGDTLFNVFSVTKGIPTTTIHIQAERGLLDYDAPIAKYWPEYGCNGKEAATVRDAITHCTGAPQMPQDITADTIGDWGFVVERIAKLPVMFPPGQPSYHAMSHGWILGELVRRTDPKKRPYAQFIQEELAQPLGIKDLWVGLPDSIDLSRLAKLVDDATGPAFPPDSALAKAAPAHLILTPRVYETPQMRRACLAATGGIFTARSEARFWGMLANGGELDGVRLLSPERIHAATKRLPAYLPDPVMFNAVMPISQGGYFLHENNFPDIAPATGPRTICYPGHGNSLGWADPDSGLAVAFCHNHMTAARSPEEHPCFHIANVIRESLGLH